MLTEKGEYSTQAEINNDKDATVKRGIPYYQMALDSLANEFAEQMNALNQAQGVTGAGDLFMNRDNPGDKITAGNIAISKDWAEGKVHMLSSTDPNAPSDDRSNLADSSRYSPKSTGLIRVIFARVPWAPPFPCRSRIGCSAPSPPCRGSDGYYCQAEQLSHP